MEVYFGVMLLGGSVAVAARKLGDVSDVDLLGTPSPVLVFGSALLVGGTVVYSSVVGLREESGTPLGGGLTGAPTGESVVPEVGDAALVRSFARTMQILLTGDSEHPGRWPTH